MDRRSRWPLLKEDLWPGHVHRLCAAGSLGECTQTEAPHYYVGGLGMTTWEWWGHWGTASTYSYNGPPGSGCRQGCHLTHSFFICGTWPQPIVPDHHFVLINPGAGGRLSSVLQQSVMYRLRLHSPLFPMTVHLHRVRLQNTPLWKPALHNVGAPADGIHASIFTCHRNHLRGTAVNSFCCFWLCNVRLTFLCGICMFALRLCGFRPGTPVLPSPTRWWLG